MKKRIDTYFTKTSSGLKIACFYDPGTKKAGIEFLTKASSSVNPPQKYGIAHFLEHLLARQSKNYPTPLKQTIALEKLPASLSGASSFHETSYSVRGGVSEIDKMTEILADTVLNPHITPKAIKSELSIIEKEIAR